LPVTTPRAVASASGSPGPRLSRWSWPTSGRSLYSDVASDWILSMKGDQVTYRVQAFAELAGVTVRALHHYDRLALLRPKRTGAGYRLYRLADLERLEQIVALKFLGLPLKEIKTVLDRDARSLPDVLRGQRRALEEKRRRLDRAIAAIGSAERSLEAGRPADAAVLRRIIEVIEMSDHAEDMRKYYSDEAWAELTRRREAMTEKTRDI